VFGTLHEHDGAKVLIAEISAAFAGEDFYDAKVKVLSELIKNHVEKEEAPSDAQAKSAGIDLVGLGERLVARKAELIAQIEAEGLPILETRSYSGRELEQGEPFAGPIFGDAR